MNTREIRYGSNDYQETLVLRNLIMRAPLGLELSEEDVAGEDKQLHWGIFWKQQLMGCIVAEILDPDKTVKLRQMAIASECQRKGYGRRLLRDVESLLRSMGIQEVVLDARQTAVPFYEKLGYTSHGEMFIRHGIEHIKMQKNL